MKGRSDLLKFACREFEEDLTLYYYGDGSVTERRRVECHLEGCARCRHFLNDLRSLLPQTAKPRELEQSFWDNYFREVVEKIANQQGRSAWWSNLLAPARAWVIPAFGTTVVALLAVALVVGKGPSKLLLNEAQEKIPQEILADANQLEFFDSMDMLESLRVLEALEGTKKEPTSGQNT